MNREGSITRTLIFMLLGPIVWALHFLVVYGSHASYCAVGERLPGQPDTVIPVLQWSATIAAALVLAGGILWPSAVRTLLRAFPPTSTSSDFIIRVMQLLALLSLFGVAFASLALVFLPICGQLR